MPPIHSGLVFIGLALSAAVSLIGLYSAGFGQASPTYYRTLMILVAVAIVLINQPLAKTERPISPAVRYLLVAVDLAIFIVMAIAVERFIAAAAEIQGGIIFLSTFETWIGLLAIVSLLELTRRVFGPPIVILAALALLFTLFGDVMPGVLHHRGFSLQTTMTQLWYSFIGIFGLPSAVILDFVLVFIVFGTILESTGAGDRLLRIVMYFTSWTRGGPAHSAIGASCLFGTMSGSVTANVVGTGSFTIPLIKSRGFGGRFAGAVEATASAGGQFMPPVMGAAAFLMAELTGQPYLMVAVAALVPALFYYGALFLTVVIEARRLGLQPLPPGQRQKLTAEDWFLTVQFLVPIAIIVTVLVMGRSAAFAGFAATIAAVALAPLNPDFRREPRRLFKGLFNGGRSAATLMVAAGALGVIIGSMEVSGLGIKFANIVLSISQDNLVIALLLTMMACILLGMGMPTLPAYLVIVLVMGPAIANFGIPIIAVHLFVLYFGVLSNVTPPVAIAAYAASPIAGANPVSIGVTAMRLSFIGFLVPFVFVFEPVLLLIAVPFDAGSFIWVAARLLLAVWLATTGVAGYARARLPVPMRVLRLTLAFVILFSGHWVAEATGVAIACALFVIEWALARRGASANVAKLAE